ncbi:MAG: 2-oxoacid:acceptor oxidoreductase family protein [Brevinematales bacterium]|nr:2-oxoacid:acceptor oxidoreductase family protein [Brevinematales bacterium]
MKEQVIISGFGGQGVLSAGFLLAEASMHAGLEVTYYPSYGAEMRGGAANCHVVIADSDIYSPVISVADTLIALSQQAFERFASLVRAGGTILADKGVKHGEGAAHVITLPFEEVTLHELGNIRVLNTVILGAYAVLHQGWLKKQWLEEAITHKFSSKGQKVVDVNLKALERGYTLL